MMQTEKNIVQFQYYQSIWVWPSRSSSNIKQYSQSQKYKSCDSILYAILEKIDNFTVCRNAKIFLSVFVQDQIIIIDIV